MKSEQRHTCFPVLASKASTAPLGPPGVAITLPSSTNGLLTMDSNYQYSKQILVDSVYNHNISSSLLLFPHQINIGNFQYAYSIKNYQLLRLHK